MSLLSRQLEQAADEVGGKIPEIIDRQRSGLLRRVSSPSWVEDDDFARFGVAASDYTKKVMALLLLDTSFELESQKELLRVTLSRSIAVIGDGDISTASDETGTQVRFLEDVFDAASVASLILDGPDSTDSRALFGASSGLLTVPSIDGATARGETRQNLVCRLLLRMLYLRQYDAALQVFDSELALDPHAFNDDPLIQMANVVYFLSAAESMQGNVVDHRVAANVWLQLCTFWWFVTHARLEYSLESYRLVAMRLASGRRTSSLTIDFRELVQDLEQSVSTSGFMM